ncbi:proton channel OTOP3 [Latimeria chalumnae]|uniref:proton channel OTOP3 n=1 Tax=Latimeria chalumnae TaxID=7897 RepID=UPI0003C1ABD8|nr:PREDICTED: otopetrin-3 [Latimeria chalumnae]|eukprot:XP_005998333.1 PREDICTED: otopetrin-3 [Latimeria chalumnae]
MTNEDRGRGSTHSQDGEKSGSTGKITYKKSWLQRNNSSLMQGKKQAKKVGKLFSGLLAVNIVFLGGALITSKIFNKAAVQMEDVQIFLMVFMGLSVIWIFYYQFYTTRKPHAVLYKDSHAGAIWLRGSLVVFGACSILLDVFKIGYFISYKECQSSVQIVFPFIEAFFITTQTYLLWWYSKDCIQVQHNFTRFGLMLSLATNVVMWMLAVTNDSIHLDIESEIHDINFTTQHPTIFPSYDGHGNSTSCKCKNEATCNIFKKGYIGLYPFNIEYCLISSSMFFVMWKNVGRLIDHNVFHIKPKFQICGTLFGLLLGALVVVVGLSIFIAYEIRDTTDKLTPQSFVLFFSFYIVVLPVMSLCTLIGTIIHRLEERELDTHKNPTRSLDVVLLLGAALGPFAISYFSLVALIATDPRELVNSLTVSYSLLMIFEHVFQNLFIIEGLHRQPLNSSEHEMTDEKDCGSSLDHQNETVSPANSVHNSTTSDTDKKSETEEKGIHEKADAPSESCHNLQNRRLSMQKTRDTSQDYIQTYAKLNGKRRALKEISMFLIMCNIILWIFPAFGAHPQFENEFLRNFYGFSIWFTILNFGLPLGVFYRMHSVGGLLELYLTA